MHTAHFYTEKVSGCFSPFLPQRFQTSPIEQWLVPSCIQTSSFLSGSPLRCLHGSLSYGLHICLAALTGWEFPLFQSAHDSLDVRIYYYPQEQEVSPLRRCHHALTYQIALIR